MSFFDAEATPKARVKVEEPSTFDFIKQMYSGDDGKRALMNTLTGVTYQVSLVRNLPKIPPILQKMARGERLTKKEAWKLLTVFNALSYEFGVCAGYAWRMGIFAEEWSARVRKGVRQARDAEADLLRFRQRNQG